MTHRALSRRADIMFFGVMALLPTADGVSLDGAVKDVIVSYHTVDDPVIQRMRVICGPNTLYLLLRSCDVSVDFSDVEQRLPIVGRGASMLGLRETAKHFRLSTRVRKCTRQSLKTLRLPAVAHLRAGLRVAVPGDHYVLLLSILDDGVVLIDGTTGLRDKVTLGKFETAWSGYILEPNMSDFAFQSFRVQITLFLTLLLFGSGWFFRNRRQKRLALVIIVVAIVPFSFVPMARADQSVPAADPDGLWRTPQNDAANALDLYLRLVNHPASRDHIVSAFGGAGPEVSLSDLSRASRILGKPLRVVRSTPRRLTAMAVPLIVHLYGDAEGHGGYFLLFRLDENECKLINAANVTLEVTSTDDFRRRWSGYAAVAEHRGISWWRSAAVGLCVLAAFVWLRSKKFPNGADQIVGTVGSGRSISP